MAMTAFAAVRSKTISDIYLNISHFLDHFIMLVFAKAAYDAGRHFGLSYEQIIVYGVAGFVLFGGMAPVAAQLADRYSRSLMMVVYHFGIGIAAMLAGMSQTVWQLGAAIGLIGVFAAIYHPVGIAMLIKSNRKIGLRLGINGVFGNMGVAAAPLIIGLLLTLGDWRLCFIVSGLFCIAYGIAFTMALGDEASPAAKAGGKLAAGFAPGWQMALGAMLLSTASGGFIFGAMTFVVPRYFEISLPNISTSVAITGLLASIVYAVASFTQVGVGWLIDRVAPKWVLFAIGVGQVVFVALAARFTDYALFFAMLVAMCFVFGQIPITDTILSRYVPDNWRARVLSIKFMVNLTIGASVLPICGAILQSGYEMAALFSLMSGLAVLVVMAGLILPVQADSQRMDRIPAE
jgi:MFS family permease